MYIFCLGVEISFQQTSYTIVECTGNAEVCVRLNGNLTENITLLLTSEDGTATGNALHTAGTLFCMHN